MRFDRFLRKFPTPIRNLIDPLSIEEERLIKEASFLVKTKGIVLDAGAGECRYKVYFPGKIYIGLDFFKGDSDWDYNNLDVGADITNLPFKSNTIDMILNNNVLEHINEPAKTIKEFYRVLKPGGHLILTVPQGWYEHQSPHDYFRFTSYGLKYLFNEAGFKIEFIKPMGGYFKYLANRLIFLSKVLFWQRSLITRILLFPLEILFVFLFVGFFPVVLNQIDFLDKEKRCTLCYKCLCTKI
ncbi:MAG: hypothetical protein A2Y48_08990 [Nitrospirae bacterium RIFCSPLOW2_12_42_9]|nr:MAG: hypothetical protein A2Y48_08990 [Nitrospirae bacterium RIFCSPLOW2_12_42_9]HBI23200.1 SAM-dependent methyltransferase [Nitrospiraceae bacterium]